MADNKEVSLSDSQTESQINIDSGIQTESMLTSSNNEVSFVDRNVAAQSTPTTRIKELSMDDLFNLIKTMSENINSNVNAKYKEQQIDSNIKYNEISARLDDKFDRQSSELNNRFDEIKTEIKSEFNCKFDVLKFNIDEVKMKCENSCNELKRDIEKIVESVAEQIKSKNTNDDNNENIVNNVVVESKITNSNNDIESGNVIEKVVSESETLKIDSETVSERESVICCNEVVISVDELEKEWKERVDECVGQRVNCSVICDEPECSKMLLLEGKRPLLMKDLNYFPFLYKFVPSVWNDVVSMISVSYTHLDVYKRQRLHTKHSKVQCTTIHQLPNQTQITGTP